MVATAGIISESLFEIDKLLEEYRKTKGLTDQELIYILSIYMGKRVCVFSERDYYLQKEKDNG